MQLVHLGGAAGARTGPGRARNVDQTNARAPENPGGKSREREEARKTKAASGIYY